MNRFVAVLCLLFSIFFSSLSAQINPGIEWSGYYEPQYMGIDKSNWTQLFSNKFRLNLEKTIDDNLYFYANFDYITYHGNREWDLTSYLPDDVAASINAVQQQFWVQTFDNRNFIDNLYLVWNGNQLRLTMGKQQLSFGSGYVWNPTDIFNKKELADPTYEQPGRNAIRVDYEWGSHSRLTFVFQPENNPEWSVYYARIKSTIEHFDLALVGSLAPIKLMTFQTGFPGIPEELRLKRKMIGVDINGELWGIGLYSETALFWQENDRHYQEWVLGMDYTTKNGIYLMAEYYVNTLFSANPSNLTPEDWFNYFSGQYKTISRHQIYTMIGISPWALTNVYLSQIFAPGEKSAAFLPMVEINLSDDLTLTLIGQWFTGTHDDVYNQKLGTGAIVRMRLYF